MTQQAPCVAIRAIAWLGQRMTQSVYASPDSQPPRAARRGRGGSEPGRRYDSAIMQNRRLRILREAQELLSEVGIEAFTINELSRRAGVAQRTLYRNLGSREDIIARAITAHYEDLLAGIPPFKARTLSQCMERGRTLALFVVALRRYATAMVTVFFSITIDRRIFEGLRSIPLKGYGNLFEDAAQAGILRPMSAAEKLLLAQRMPHLSYGLVSDWAAGRLTDDEFIERSPISFVLSMYPYFTDVVRDEADTIIAAHAARVAASTALADE